MKQLNDISFSSNEEEEEFSNLNWLPGNVLTEDKIKEIVSSQTQKLILENHYWISDHFISKMGRMATNLKHLSFKGINMSNSAFMDCVSRLNQL